MRELVARGILSVQNNVGYFVKDINALVSENLRQRKGLIGLIVPNFRNRYFTAYFQGIYDGLHDSGFNILLGDSEEDRTRERAEIFSFIRKGVDGLILFPYQDDIDAEYVKQLDSLGIPYVLSHCSPGVRADMVNVDNRGGAERAVTFLKECGHRRIAFFCFGTVDQWHFVRERHAGYVSALGTGSHDAPGGLVFQHQRESNHGGLSRVVREMIERGVTAVFCCSDAEAHDLVKACRDDGIRVPEDLSVIGFNNFTFLWSPPVRPFTTMGIDYYRIGTLLSRTLLSKLEPSEPSPGGTVTPRRSRRTTRRTVPVELIERGSVLKLKRV